MLTPEYLSALPDAVVKLWSQAEDALGSFGERAWFLRAFAETLRNRKK